MELGGVPQKMDESPQCNRYSMYGNVLVQEIQTSRVATPQKELHMYPYTCKSLNSLQSYIHRISVALGRFIHFLRNTT